MAYIIRSFSIEESDDNKKLLKAFGGLAAKDGWSFSRIVFEAIKEYTIRHDPGNPQLALAHWTEEAPLPITLLEKGQKKFSEVAREEKQRGEQRWAKLNALTNEELLSRQSRLLERDGSYMERMEISMILMHRRMANVPLEEHLP